MRAALSRSTHTVRDKLAPFGVAGYRRLPAMLIERLSLQIVEDGDLTIPGDTAQVTSSDIAVTIAHRMIGSRPTEHIMILPVDANVNITGAIIVAAGGAHNCGIEPVTILRSVLVCHCAAFLIAHNHPSGNPEPSPEDRNATRKLVEACKVVGVHMLDHLIVTRSPARWSTVPHE